MKNKAAILRLCGIANYLSQTIRPLFEMTKADREYIWAPVHQAEFDSAKRLIAQAPCLRYFDITKQIVLQVAASQGSLGGALLQPTSNGQLQPHPNVVPSVTTMVHAVSSSVDVSAGLIVQSSPEIVNTQAQSSPRVQQSRVESKSPIITRSGRISNPK